MQVDVRRYNINSISHAVQGAKPAKTKKTGKGEFYYFLQSVLTPVKRQAKPNKKIIKKVIDKIKKKWYNKYRKSEKENTARSGGKWFSSQEGGNAISWLEQELSRKNKITFLKKLLTNKRAYDIIRFVRSQGESERQITDTKGAQRSTRNEVFSLFKKVANFLKKLLTSYKSYDIIST